jgi:hypothetical protein
MDRSNSPPIASLPSRRASIAPGSSFSDLLRSSSSGASMNNQNGSPPFTSPIASVAANAQTQHRRRLSITTLGLSGSPTQTSPFTSRPLRRESGSSSVDSGSAVLEEAIEDGDASFPTNSSPFARRFSFGAQALREVRSGGSTGNGDRFNWSEALRTRAERAPSFGGLYPAPGAQQGSPNTADAHHHRAASIAIMEQPTQETPRPARKNKPDFFQEKILRADFMD